MATYLMYNPSETTFVYSSKPMQDPECPCQIWHGKTNLRPVYVSSLHLTVSKSLDYPTPFLTVYAKKRADTCSCSMPRM